MASRSSRPHPAAGRRGQQGAVLVELALVLLPLLLLLTATVDLGRAFYTYNTLAKAARDAARHLALSNPPDMAAQQEAKNLVLYGDVVASGATLVSDLDSSMVSVCTPALCADHKDVEIPGGSKVDLVSVRVTGYDYVSLFGAMLPAKLGFSTINVTMRTGPW